MRTWTLEYDSNFDNHPPVVSSGPDISPEEMEVTVASVNDLVERLKTCVLTSPEPFEAVKKLITELEKSGGGV